MGCLRSREKLQAGFGLNLPEQEGAGLGPGFRGLGENAVLALGLKQPWDPLLKAPVSRTLRKSEDTNFLG